MIGHVERRSVPLMMLDGAFMAVSLAFMCRIIGAWR